MQRTLPLILTACVLAGCTIEDAAGPLANPEFSDAAKFAFVEFDAEREADLAFVMREFETQIYLAIDPEAEASTDRVMQLSDLTAADIGDLGTLPDVYPEGFDLEGQPVDPARTFPMAVVRTSAHLPEDHVGYMVLEDQVPVEPSSPDHYDRTFLDGTEVCFPAQDCDRLLTENYLTKDNALLTITYDLIKQYRWVDLNLPDPGGFTVDDVIVNDGPKRWAIIARSWDPNVAIGDNGSTAIFQSYSVEVWFPRDGGGFVRDGEANADGGEWTADSTGGGALRLLALWSDTSFGDSAIVINATRNGIDDIFTVQEEWIDAN
ncbi:MAG: hypothetical protein GY898_20855 [Proteobacteria bacterium]|nr:hypothetical protein [Pseudomonadota bacterium]